MKPDDRTWMRGTADSFLFTARIVRLLPEELGRQG